MRDPHEDPEPVPIRDPLDPAARKPLALSYRRPEPTGLVTIARLRSVEAQLARAKLQAEGIEAFVADENMSIAHPLLFSEVPLQVLVQDAEFAREILDSVPDDSEPGEYVEEEWRCPSCHRKAVDLLPLSRSWRTTRGGCLLVLAAPFLLLLVQWIVPIPEFVRKTDETAEYLAMPWVLTLGVLGTAVLLAKRKKRCRKCGHEWVRSTEKPRQPTRDDES